jgi:hypothetical protein
MRPPRDREAELATIGPVAFAGVEIKARLPEPGYSQILKQMTDREDAQRLPGKILAFIFSVSVNSNCSARSQAWPRREPPR